MPFTRKKRLILLAAAAVVVVVLIGIALKFYAVIFSPNVRTGDVKTYLYIRTGADFNDVMDSLVRKKILKNAASFRWVAGKRDYPEKIKPGKYLLKNRMSNLELVRLLMSGRQEPVNVVFNNIRTKQDLAGKVGRQLEADSLRLLQLMNNREFLEKYGLTPWSVFRLFIPNSYEFWWNTSSEGFFERMYKEQKKFWNEERVRKTRLTGLSVDQVIVLASIVEKETNKDSEKPVIAGVYMNRLRKGWPLQADPTLIFAMNDYSIKRVRAEHKLVNSPYNTYLNKGLPPGPICLPSISSIDAVLNYNRNNYMYFCAREDLSGYHIFAENIEQHTRNARRYQAALNRLNIR